MTALALAEAGYAEAVAITAAYTAVRATRAAAGNTAGVREADAQIAAAERREYAAWDLVRHERSLREAALGALRRAD